MERNEKWWFNLYICNTLLENAFLIKCVSQPLILLSNLIFATRCRISNYLLDQTIVSFKYKRFTPSGCEDIGIRKFEFVAKTQFLYDF